MKKYVVMSLVSLYTAALLSMHQRPGSANDLNQVANQNAARTRQERINQHADGQLQHARATGTPALLNPQASDRVQTGIRNNNNTFSSKTLPDFSR